MDKKLAQMVILRAFAFPWLFCATFLVLALCASLTIRGLGYTHSILGFCFATAGGLSCRYSVRILVGGSTSPRIRVVGRGTSAIAANGLAACILDAILAKQT
jgi:hypothetical protein